MPLWPVLSHSNYVSGCFPANQQYPTSLRAVRSPSAHAHCHLDYISTKQMMTTASELGNYQALSQRPLNFETLALEMWKYESQEEESRAFQSLWGSKVGLQWGESSRVRSTQQYTEGKEKAEKSDSIMQELPNDCWHVGLCDELLEGVALSPWLSCFSLSLPSWPPEYWTLPAVNEWSRCIKCQPYQGSRFDL